MRTIPLMLLLSLTVGCAGRRARAPLFDLVIPRAGLIEDPRLLQCDLQQNPPKCKAARIVYKKGSAIIQAK